jgi:coenzyme F420-reducing hydrogenase alpha subunit
MKYDNLKMMDGTTLGERRQHFDATDVEGLKKRIEMLSKVLRGYSICPRCLCEVSRLQEDFCGVCMEQLKMTKDEET